MIIDAVFKEEEGMKADFGVVNIVGNGGGGGVSLEYVNQTFANALKGRVSGNPIRIDDSSPLKHELIVGLESKNLLPYPYKTTTKTESGVTFTDNGDGTVTANGTATAKVTFVANRIPAILGQYYTASGCPHFETETNVYLAIQHQSVGGTNYYSHFERGLGVTFQPHAQAEYINLLIVIEKDTKVENAVFRPQIEFGTTATPYTPYVDTNDTTVTKYGKNLFNPNGKVYKTYLNNSGTEIFWGGASDSRCFVIPCLPNTTYTISRLDSSRIFKVAYIKAQEEDFPKYDGDKVDAFGYDATEYVPQKTITTGEGATYIIVQFGKTVIDNGTIQPITQCEVGSSATEFEEYKEPETYTADENGNVQGITANGEPMTLVAESGATITAEYNKDTNKAFESLVNAIISLGGNV